MLLVWVFLEQQLINCFRKIRVVLKMTFEWLTAVVLKGLIEGLADVLLRLLLGVGSLWRRWRLGCCSCCQAVVVGGEVAGAGVSTGKNSCGVPICW